jgi:hypothetical protein
MTFLLESVPVHVLFFHLFSLPSENNPSKDHIVFYLTPSAGFQFIMAPIMIDFIFIPPLLAPLCLLSVSVIFIDSSSLPLYLLFLLHFSISH